jgi:hypothetical protein
MNPYICVYFIFRFSSRVLHFVGAGGRKCEGHQIICFAGLLGEPTRLLIPPFIVELPPPT